MTNFEVTKMVRDVLKTAQIGCAYSIPVQVNGRLKRTLGQAVFTINRFTGEFKPMKIEFSRDFLTRATDECIKQVILHECAHIIANIRAGRNCGHGAEFKRVCREIGCKANKAQTNVEYKAPKKPVAVAPKVTRVAKYTVICINCQKIVATFERDCKTLKLAKAGRCRCKNCGNRDFMVI